MPDRIKCPINTTVLKDLPQVQSVPTFLPTYRSTYKAEWQNESNTKSKFKNAMFNVLDYVNLLWKVVCFPLK